MCASSRLVCFYRIRKRVEYIYIYLYLKNQYLIRVLYMPTLGLILFHLPPASLLHLSLFPSLLPRSSLYFPMEGTPVGGWGARAPPVPPTASIMEMKR